MTQIKNLAGVYLQINSDLKNQKHLIFSLLTIFAIWSTAYLLGKDVSIKVNDYVTIPITLLIVMNGIYRILTSENRTSRYTWILFSIFAMSWSIAEHIWSLNELVLDVKPFPSFADVGYIIGTIVLPVFYIMLLQPFKKYISKQFIITSISIGLCIIIFETYISWPISGSDFTAILLSAYPILDGLVLMPAFVITILGIKKKMDFSSMLLCFAMMLVTVGDIIFQITTRNGTYYSGSLSDLFYVLSYALFAFGSYNKTQPRQNRSIKNT